MFNFMCILCKAQRNNCFAFSDHLKSLLEFRMRFIIALSPHTSKVMGANQVHPPRMSVLHNRILSSKYVPILSRVPRLPSFLPPLTDTRVRWPGHLAWHVAVCGCVWLSLQMWVWCDCPRLWISTSLLTSPITEYGCIDGWMWLARQVNGFFVVAVVITLAFI